MSVTERGGGRRFLVAGSGNPARAPFWSRNPGRGMVSEILGAGFEDSGNLVIQLME